MADIVLRAGLIMMNKNKLVPVLLECVEWREKKDVI